MTLFTRPNFLRTILLIDAATCIASGLLMTIGASALAGLTQLPPDVLKMAGLSLFPIAAFMAFVAIRTPSSLPGVYLVILGNLGWAAGSLWLLLADVLSPNGFGNAFVLLQAGGVTLLAGLEFMGARITAAFA